MTNYGSIPTPTATSNTENISRAKERIRSGLATRRPWKVMLDLRSLRLPSGFSDALSRLRSNLGYFRTNYAIVALVIVFLSLLWHPISLIVFLAMMCAWLFLYFLRDEPLIVFRRTIGDRVVLAVLAVLTLVFLFLTHATWNILGALLVAVVLVLLHAAFRKTDDLYVDEEAAASGGLLTAVGGGGGASSSTST